LATSPSRLERRAKPGSAIDAEIVAVTALLSAVLVVGLATAADYGLTVDEFNTDDYGPKALAWYTSGFVDRSHFETVEFPLWYYGPWFQMLTAYIQSFDLADRVTVRHAMTFLVGLAGVAALLPIGRLAVGRWARLAAVALCLMTGYFYGSLFFTPTPSRRTPARASWRKRDPRRGSYRTKGTSRCRRPTSGAMCVGSVL
jgi:hypothetical protein